MALNLTPFTWNWSTITAGDTYPASRWVESNSEYDTALARVRCTIANEQGQIFRTLDSTGSNGIVINTATAGAWDFTIGALTAPSESGIYCVEVEWIDASGVVFTEATGQWEILPQKTI